MLIIPKDQALRVVMSGPNYHSLTGDDWMLHVGQLKLDEYDSSINNQRLTEKNGGSTSRSITTGAKRANGTIVSITAFETIETEKHPCQSVYFLSDGRVFGYYFLFLPGGTEASLDSTKTDAVVRVIVENNQW